MNGLMRVAVPLGCLVLLALAWHEYGGRGVAVVGGGLLMWLLLHYTRLMTVMKRAADRPIGYVGSAVMLNAKLKGRWPLLQVVALTKSLGERRSAEGVQPEVYRWTDGGGSWVDCSFQDGRLVHWELVRPHPVAEGTAAGTGA